MRLIDAHVGVRVLNVSVRSTTHFNGVEGTILENNGYKVTVRWDHNNRTGLVLNQTYTRSSNIRVKLLPTNMLEMQPKEIRL